MRVVWTRRSLRELAAIGDYVAERNPRAAARLVNTIHSTARMLLGANPFI